MKRFSRPEFVQTYAAATIPSDDEELLESDSEDELGRRIAEHHRARIAAGNVNIHRVPFWRARQKPSIPAPRPTVETVVSAGDAILPHRVAFTGDLPLPPPEVSPARPAPSPPVSAPLPAPLPAATNNNGRRIDTMMREKLATIEALSQRASRLAPTKPALGGGGMPTEELAARESDRSDSAPSDSATPAPAAPAKCEHCAHCSGSAWRALWTEARDNFYTYDTTNDHRLQLTNAGYMVFFAMIYFFSEILLGTVFDSYLLDASFPFIGVTIFWRAITSPIETVSWLFGILFNFVFDDSAAVTEPVATWYRAEERPTTAGEWLDTALSAAGTITTRALSATGTITTRIMHSTMTAMSELENAWDDDWASM
ncbi:unnamed protein product [Zymoseptoria tritici ST99CH_1A5]|uniref:Uncharacterized protein n=3 Tax=Zymoseptoria tritici TaxID=1047171 RepID=A0A1X7RJ79_ZYMT9|nr:unnamed protein product [Zymoseptoria tritici ST99CH_3D7]SMR45799.1 unnamed protein product [Zymoseptoria tritici ST99CH_1E4]SMY20953.1 unnamed protein product [Zymoseptoria tritici ST99CH_1A5]